MLSSADHALACEPLYVLDDLSPPASAQGLRLNRLLWLLLAITNLVDVIGTARAFELGIGELNPIVAMFHNTFGLAGIAAPKLLFLTALLVLLPWIRSWTRIMFAFACSVYLALTVIHIWFLSPLI